MCTIHWWVLVQERRLRRMSSCLVPYCLHPLRFTFCTQDVSFLVSLQALCDSYTCAYAFADRPFCPLSDWVGRWMEGGCLLLPSRRWHWLESYKWLNQCVSVTVGCNQCSYPTHTVTQAVLNPCAKCRLSFSFLIRFKDLAFIPAFKV